VSIEQCDALDNRCEVTYLTVERARRNLGRAPPKNELELPGSPMDISQAEDAVGINSVARSATSRPDVAASGWDPYEVWRTRVLLPRLAQHHGRDETSAGAVQRELHPTQAIG